MTFFSFFFGGGGTLTPPIYFQRSRPEPPGSTPLPRLSILLSQQPAVCCTNKSVEKHHQNFPAGTAVTSASLGVIRSRIPVPPSGDRRWQS